MIAASGTQARATPTTPAHDAGGQPRAGGTRAPQSATISPARGEVAERLNAAVSKTVMPRKRYRGFESPPLRLMAYLQVKSECSPVAETGFLRSWGQSAARWWHFGDERIISGQTGADGTAFGARPTRDWGERPGAVVDS